MIKSATVVGAIGIVSRATAFLLLHQGWTVYGLAWRPIGQALVEPVAADLQDASQTSARLIGIRLDAVFIASWSRQATQPENIRVNGAMARHPLAAMPMQFALAWLMRRAPNMLRIPGTSSGSYLREYVAAAALKPPDEAFGDFAGIATE